VSPGRGIWGRPLSFATTSAAGNSFCVETSAVLKWWILTVVVAETLLFLAVSFFVLSFNKQSRRCAVAVVACAVTLVLAVATMGVGHFAAWNAGAECRRSTFGVGMVCWSSLRFLMLFLFGAVLASRYRQSGRFSLRRDNI